MADAANSDNLVFGLGNEIRSCPKTGRACAVDQSAALTWTGKETFNAHILSNGPTPTVTGSNCSLVRGSDSFGTITMATGSADNCTVTFGTTFGAIPSCSLGIGE